MKALWTYVGLFNPRDGIHQELWECMACRALVRDNRENLRKEGPREAHLKWHETLKGSES